MISIIIPIYNEERYLAKCLDSLVTQTCTDWEALLVDDGSIDGSVSICDDYMRKDGRFRVFHVPHAGVSQARNVGLEHASGKWLMFVDADDWLQPECLQTCLEEVVRHDLDIVQFSLVRVDTSGHSLYYCMKGTPVYNLEQYISADKFNLCAAGSLMRRGIVERHGLRFPTNMSLGEDQMFMIPYLRHCTRMRSLPDVMYNYLYTQEGYMEKLSQDALVKSIHSLALAKRENPLFASACDGTIVGFCIQLLAYTDCSVDMVKQLYKESDISGPVHWRSHQWFVWLCRINTGFTMHFYRTMLKRRR